MNLTVKTDTLKEMLSKAVKGATNNRLIPLTSLMCIQLENGILTITTTDATNYLYVKEDKIEGDNFYVVIEVETFSKLVARLTCENVTLTLKDNSLEVKGNGTYNIAIPLDEEGNMIKYPDPIADIQLDEDKAKDINMAIISTILESVKPSLATTLELPCYTGYYVGDTVVATDTYKIASMAVKLFDEPKLISPEMMNLLSVMTSEKINVQVEDNVLVFTSPDVAVYGTVLDGIDDFAIDKINELADTEFESVCKISKSALLQVLDRLSLFVGVYDKNGISLVFTEEGLQVSSKSSNGVEIIKYTESENFKDFSCMIDIVMFMSQVKATASDVVTLHYGNEGAIKLTDGNITQVVALLME